jgi:divalent metal cation (Fe/Co/Zn/Cd) transporter
VDPSISRSRAGLRPVALSLGTLGPTAAIRAIVFALSGSVALPAGLIHPSPTRSSAWRSQSQSCASPGIPG